MCNPIRVTFGPEKDNTGQLISKIDPRGQWIFDPSHKIDISIVVDDENNKPVQPTVNGG